MEFAQVITFFSSTELLPKIQIIFQIKLSLSTPMVPSISPYATNYAQSWNAGRGTHNTITSLSTWMPFRPKTHAEYWVHRHFGQLRPQYCLRIKGECNDMSTNIVCNRYIMGSTAAGGRARATPRISNHCLRGCVAPCWISGVMTCTLGTFSLFKIWIWYLLFKKQLHFVLY